MEKNISRTPFCSITFPIIFIIFISNSCLNQAIANDLSGIESRQVLEIGIGIGGSPPPASPPDYGDCPDCNQPEPPCPPPPPPPCPPPPPPPHQPPRPSHPPPPPPSHPPPPPPSHPPPPKRKPPSHPPPPPPSDDFPPFDLSVELKQNIKDIQRLRGLITGDPLGITRSWTGNKLCRDKSKYIGFICDTTTDTKQTRIAGVKFNGYRFSGNLSVADVLGRFTGAIFFHANTNFFKGQVPTDAFKKMPTLYEFDVSNNQLTGGFPEAVLHSNLTFLDIRFNKFTGPIPSQVFDLDLDALFLNNNQFTGTIPSNLGHTPVVYLTLANNMFQGPIPKSIGQAGNTLLEVLFLNNRLSGCLPYEIGLLKKTEVFDASGNQLTGSIPRSFGCLKNMEILNFANNHLYGAVPEELCSIKSLQTLTLRNNYFTQVGPQCRKLIQSKKLDLSMNCIIDLGSQKKPAECMAFFLKHPNDCPEQLQIPCKLENYDAQLNDESPKKQSKHSRAYAALHNHHH